jgi:hypothetical protein
LRPVALRCAAFVLSCAVGACAATAGPARAADPPVPAIGVTSHATWDYASDADRTAAMDKMAAAGITWLRIDLCWCQFEAGGPGIYNLAYVGLVDHVLDEAHARGFKVLAILWGTPGWANGSKGPSTPPTSSADYAHDAQWVAQHFAGRVSAWEVWNEPNLSVFWNGDAAQYAHLLQAAYPAFKVGDPAAKVVFGGLSFNDDSWLAQAYAAGAHGSFDVMATHPYQAAGNAPPETADDGHKYWLTHVATIHDLMARNGDGGKEIWFTEFGWSTHDTPANATPNLYGVTPEQQGDYFTRTIQLVRRDFPYVTQLFWYDDRNDASGDLWDDNLGLLNRDLSAKPALAMLKAFLDNPPPPAPPPTPSPSPSPSPPPPALPPSSPPPSSTPPAPPAPPPASQPLTTRTVHATLLHARRPTRWRTHRQRRLRLAHHR